MLFFQNCRDQGKSSFFYSKFDKHLLFKQNQIRPNKDFIKIASSFKWHINQNFFDHVPERIFISCDITFVKLWHFLVMWIHFT